MLAEEGVELMFFVSKNQILIPEYEVPDAKTMSMQVSVFERGSNRWWILAPNTSTLQCRLIGLVSAAPHQNSHHHTTKMIAHRDFINAHCNSAGN
jgi:hypothetical protein